MVKPSGGPYWAKLRCWGRGNMSNGSIHWSAGAWRKDSVGEAGGANGREAEGGVVSWSKWAESAYSIGGGGQQPSETGGTRLPDQNEGGADPGGAGCGFCMERRPGSCNPSLSNCGMRGSLERRIRGLEI